MKCTTIILCIAAAVLNSCALGQLPSSPWTVVLRAVDDDGNPVVGAKASIAYHASTPLGQPLGVAEQSRQFEGLTDTNGFFQATHTDDSLSLGLRVEKSGYYPFTQVYELYLPGQFDQRVVDANRNTTVTAVLRPIKHPIAMYAKAVNLGLPVFDKPAGYDFMIGDWVSPYGSGIATDIIFQGHIDSKAGGKTDYTLNVSFPNIGDGIQEFKVPTSRFPNQGSGLRLPNDAPVSGYLAQWTQADNARSGAPTGTNRDQNRNYFIRVRTTLDSNGNVQSALYGKIYGDFLKFQYYLNPTPNDRNTEFDPKQNLLSGLKSFEQVSAP